MGAITKHPNIFVAAPKIGGARWVQRNNRRYRPWHRQCHSRAGMAL